MLFTGGNFVQETQHFDITTDNDLNSVVSYFWPETALVELSPLEKCYQNPDRYNWIKYASTYDWPLDQVAFIVDLESKGDLCSINSSSGAICWIQQHPGDYIFLDPVLCMSQAYSKWVDGGGSWWRHWCRWWPEHLQPTCPG
jgi:hypothetical protein